MIKAAQRRNAQQCMMIERVQLVRIKRYANCILIRGNVNRFRFRSIVLHVGGKVRNLKRTARSTTQFHVDTIVISDITAPTMTIPRRSGVCFMPPCRYLVILTWVHVAEHGLNQVADAFFTRRGRCVRNNVENKFIYRECQLVRNNGMKARNAPGFFLLLRTIHLTFFWFFLAWMWRKTGLLPLPVFLAAASDRSWSFAGPPQPVQTQLADGPKLAQGRVCCSRPRFATGNHVRASARVFLLL